MNKIEFEYEGVWITDPTLDETGRFEVNPVEYYGETYKAIVLMENLNLKYKRSSEVTLDEYLFTYGSTLEPSEFDEVVYLLVEMSNN